MRELVVISGKGGTGKTSIVGALAALARDKVLCDADVDAADLHLLLAPEIIDKHDFRSGHQAVIDRERCIECGDCVDLCRFDAISADFQVNGLMCEGCGVCIHFCPANAIDFPENLCGEWYLSQTRFGPLVHARLGIAEENSGKLVSLVRKEARNLAEQRGLEWLITDGPPGVGCPVIASIGNADGVLIVSEPTVSGRHDLERVVQLAKHFQIPVSICVNKADLYWDAAKSIEKWCHAQGHAFLGHLPFDPDFTRAQVDRKTIVEYADGVVVENLRRLWTELQEILQHS